MKGGAIGNKLTERLGKLIMKRHDKKYLEKLIALGLENEDFARYVDDETEVLAAIQSRTKKTSPFSQQNKFFGLNNSISARTKIQHFQSENYSRCPINRNVSNFYLSFSRTKNVIRL